MNTSKSRAKKFELLATLKAGQIELQDCKDPSGKCKGECPRNFECVTVTYVDAKGNVLKTDCVCMRTRPD